jgi:hypothetical protein
MISHVVSLLQQISLGIWQRQPLVVEADGCFRCPSPATEGGLQVTGTYPSSILPAGTGGVQAWGKWRALLRLVQIGSEPDSQVGACLWNPQSPGGEEDCRVPYKSSAPSVISVGSEHQPCTVCVVGRMIYLLSYQTTVNCGCRDC